MPWTYILRCSDGSFYVGSAHHLENRVDQHNEGAVAGYTESRRPVELVWAHASDRIDEAWGLERQIKGWSRAKRIALIEGRFVDLPGLARGRSKRSG